MQTSIPTSTLARSTLVHLIVDEHHLAEVVEKLVLSARVSVWLATANLKGMMVEPPTGTVAKARRRYSSVLERLEGLAAAGVELRLLHASQPSRAFKESLSRQRRLREGGLEMRLCPRSHMKLIVADGKSAYVGSANFTGAGLGAKAAGRRNFEMGLLVDDDVLLDAMQKQFDEIWSGRRCTGCRLRSHCPRPIDGLE